MIYVSSIHTIAFILTADENKLKKEKASQTCFVLKVYIYIYFKNKVSVYKIQKGSTTGCNSHLGPLYGS